MAKSTVTATEAGRVLVDGAHNRKLGGDVLVGRLKGARLFQVTLATRITCPRYCPLWTACYDPRVHGSSKRLLPGRDLEEMLEREVQEACEQHEIVLIRLHLLGDFYSHLYIHLWDQLLYDLPNLYVFGFTARTRSGADRLADHLEWMREHWGDRFMIRFSGRETEVIEGEPDGRKFTGSGALVCPEQRHAITAPKRQTHCGSCGACWETNERIAFWAH